MFGAHTRAIFHAGQQVLNPCLSGAKELVIEHIERTGTDSPLGQRAFERLSLTGADLEIIPENDCLGIRVKMPEFL